MGETVIATRGLAKRYGAVTAVEGLDLAIGAGTVFGLLGPNGSGKTTTILMLMGLTEISAGEVRVVGFDPARQPLEVKRLVGYMPDSVGFYDNMTARQNLRFTGRLAGIARGALDPRIEAAVARVGPRRLARPAGRRLLAWHAPAPRPRRGSAEGTARRHPRRADQRARSGRHARVAGPDPHASRRGDDDPPVLAPARPRAGGVRPRRAVPSRPDGAGGHGGRPRPHGDGRALPHRDRGDAGRAGRPAAASARRGAGRAARREALRHRRRHRPARRAGRGGHRRGRGGARA